jgi:hypothetical protein
VRAKFINEKFTQDSDPIADMNIGMIHQIKLWMKSIDQPFIDKDNALIFSAYYGKLDFVKYLLAAGADVHANDDYALRWASEYGHTEMVKVLLAAGADVHTKDNYALRWASNNGHTEVVKVLLAAGADVHANDDLALQWACSNGHTEVVKVLKDHIAKEKRKKIKESLNEKFTEDDVDPIKSMGIGAKIVYYELKPFMVKDHYEIVITGNTFDIKNIIKKYSFKWSSIHKGWKSARPRTLEHWQKIASELFTEIEKIPGYVIEKRKNPGTPTNSPAIGKWDISEYPRVDDGTGLKIYVKLLEEPFYIISLMGKGTYIARNLLKYFKFNFNKEKHAWEKIYHNKFEIDDMLKYLKENNYEIIDYRKDK